MEFDLVDEAATQRLGVELAQRISAPQSLWLSGELGAGKTTLVRAWLRGLGYVGAVKSPTYTLVESYSLDNFACHHMDLYRIVDAEELEFAGLLDLIAGDDLIFIEWPERGADVLPRPDVSIQLTYLPAGRRVRLDVESPTTAQSLVGLGSLFESDT